VRGTRVGRLSARDTAKAAPAIRGRETILLIEDEELVRQLYSDALKLYGYAVLVAQDGQHALSLIEDHGGHIDLLLADVVMPHMGGREVAEKLRTRFPKMKVLYVSGYTDDAVLRNGLVQGEVPFLQKPATPIQMATKVRSVLDTVG
jgi:two-component system, cell cycle sensor histidine kinase and response regulator CckA